MQKRSSNGNVGSNSGVLNLLGEVKARVQDKLGSVDFPMPQFIVVGKQSVGKSRLIETFAGEAFNFISGSLGSRRPTVLEFRHIKEETPTKWFVRNAQTNVWEQHPIGKVMEIVGKRHEELGETCSATPCYVRIEGPGCVDMQIVDLPGFREFSVNQDKKDLGEAIESMVMTFMRDPRNVMLCVEQAGDAATMSTLARCQQVDPRAERTILIRNKLDKYYRDLTKENVNAWCDGHGDLPDQLKRFACSLPFWKEGEQPPKPLKELTKDSAAQDVQTLTNLGTSSKNLEGIGFLSLASFMEKKIETMFNDAIHPVQNSLIELKEQAEADRANLEVELANTDPTRMLGTVRDCGVSFANALGHVLEGVLNLEPAVNLEEELKSFHEYVKSEGSTTMHLVPSQDFEGLSQWVEYLRDEMQVASMDVELNGGAQMRRLMTEVEVFLRFSEIATETKKRDVVQARGISISTLTWRDVVVKLLSNEAHHPLQQSVQYVGSRIAWFFMTQKECVLNFMTGLEGTPMAKLHSPLHITHGKMIKANGMIRELVYQCYDKVCQNQLRLFLDLFDNMLLSTFYNPWVVLKSAAALRDAALEESENLEDQVLPSFDDTKERIPVEIESRSGAEAMVQEQLMTIPNDAASIDEAVDQVQTIVLKTYGLIRSQVCDQVELFSESFFKLPMLRRLEEQMAQIELNPEDGEVFSKRREVLEVELKKMKSHMSEIEWCITRIQTYLLNGK